MSQKDPDCLTGGDRDTGENFLQVSYVTLSLCHCIEGRGMKGLVPGPTAQKLRGSGDGISCRNIDASLIAKTFVETSRGHRTSGRDLSFWSSARQTSPNPRGWAGIQVPTFPLGTQEQFSHYVAHMGGTALHTNVIYNKFVHACISFPTKAILIFVLFLNSYAVYHNLS